MSKEREIGERAWSRVGPYRIVRRIGLGGMAEVFEAEEEQLGQRVALKRLHPNVVARPGATARFLREGRALARVKHPHIVQVFATGEEGGAPFLAMELLDGEDLAALLERERRLPLGEVLDIVLPVLAGMSVAHDAGVIHRDLKPSNVFLSRGPGGRTWPKVVDFGISKLVANEGACLTDSEAFVGTVAYMAPEQARALRNASFQSDQYSLGVLVYQCLTGALPFGGCGVLETLQSIMTAPLAPPSALAPDLPNGIDGVVLRAMQRDPQQRFRSLRALGAALLPYASAPARETWGTSFEERLVDPPAMCLDPPPMAPEDSFARADDSGPPDGTVAETIPFANRSPRRGAAVWVGVAAVLFALVGLARARPAPTELQERGRAPLTTSPHLPVHPVESIGLPSLDPPATEALPTAASRASEVPAQPSSSVSSPRAPASMSRGRARARPASSVARHDAAPTIVLGENDAPILP